MSIQVLLQPTSGKTGKLAVDLMAILGIPISMADWAGAFGLIYSILGTIWLSMRIYTLWPEFIEKIHERFKAKTKK